LKTAKDRAQKAKSTIDSKKSAWYNGMQWDKVKQGGGNVWRATDLQGSMGMPED
jgi:hypothetical protein